MSLAVKNGSHKINFGKSRMRESGGKGLDRDNPLFMSLTGSGKPSQPLPLTTPPSGAGTAMDTVI